MKIAEIFFVENSERVRPEFSRALEELAAEIDGLTLDGLNAYLGRRRPGVRTIQTLGPEALNPPA